MIFIVLLLLFLLVFYLYSTRNYNYWAKRNVKHDPPILLFGTHANNIFGKMSITEVAVDLYKRYPKEKVVGYYRGNTPELLIRDPNIIRNILTVDFPYFYKRGLMRDVNKEPMMKNLFSVDGDLWKLYRQRLTPAFTTFKLKQMFPLVVNCANKLQKSVETKAENHDVIDVRELMARFTTEFIGACGFGIEMDTINNEKSEFRAIGSYIFERNLRTVILIALVEIIPELKPYVAVTGPKASDAIIAIFEKIREQRNYKPIGRNDFVDLLLELEMKGPIKVESVEKRKEDGRPIRVEMETDIVGMAAQLFVFFAAGFETSSSVTSYLLHELAFNLQIQEKIQKEIEEVLLRYNNKLCYDAINEMTYLEMTFKEAMRKFPSLGVLNRECCKKHVLAGTDITIDPGVKILIPVQALQNDHNYFDNPSEFRPERFTSENLKNIPNYAYFPFGEGPRACIGARLGQMQSLAGVAALLHKFTFKPAETTKRNLKVNGFSNVVQSISGGVPLQIYKRNN